MARPRGCWVFVLICVGCHSILLPDLESESSAGSALAAQEPRQIGTFEPRLAVEPQAVSSPLALAASFLEKGDQAAACEQLGLYLSTHSTHFEVRLHFAELLLQRGLLQQAQAEFARVVADAQERGNAALPERLRCHVLMIEIAEAEDDRYGVHLNRGVGLYLLARERAKIHGENNQLPAEGLLCRAAAELLGAATQSPQEAQACWYLSLVWAGLGQTGPAERWLTRAAALAPFSKLTASEQRGLEFALLNRQRLARRP